MTRPTVGFVGRVIGSIVLIWTNARTPEMGQTSYGNVSLQV
jgi:hypothetical protein